MSVYGPGLKGHATALHAKVVRQRGACESCGNRFSLQCAHIIPRRFAATRCDPANAYCLCLWCHQRFTDHPDDFKEFIRSTIGEREYDRLKAAANDSTVKANDDLWRRWIDELAPQVRP